ncbi:MAG: 16S rRNA (adenine(1518)-N(6)/adenine(1519)-N(6))-dimethyltransferase RsmA [Candidatus Omnitrophota bacterium]
MRITDPTPQFIAKKQLGQNFLVDPRVKQRIISACELQPEETVLEIGAGRGELTREISPKVKQLIAIETDRALCRELEGQFTHTNVTVIHEDFLKLSFEKLPRPLKVIGNLPYYITTPIVERILTRSDIFRSLYITVQYELGVRITAKKDRKDYGAFSCFVQYYATPEKLFNIKNTAFRPIPKVDSCFVKLDIHPRPLYPAENEDLLFQIIQKAFQQRRKKISNSIPSLLKTTSLLEILQCLDLDPHDRAENLSVKNFVEIANSIAASRTEPRV